MSGQKERLVHHLVVRMVTVTLQGSLPTHAQLDLETEMEWVEIPKLGPSHLSFNVPPATMSLAKLTNTIM